MNPNCFDRKGVQLWVCSIALPIMNKLHWLFPFLVLVIGNVSLLSLAGVSPADLRLLAALALNGLSWSWLVGRLLKAKAYPTVVFAICLYLGWLLVENSYGVYSLNREAKPNPVSSLVFCLAFSAVFISGEIVLSQLFRNGPRKVGLAVVDCWRTIVFFIPLAYLVNYFSTGSSLTAESFVAIFVNQVQDIFSYIRYFIPSAYLVGSFLLIGWVGLFGTLHPRHPSMTGVDCCARIGGLNGTAVIVVLFIFFSVSCFRWPMHSAFFSVVKNGVNYLNTLKGRGASLSDVQAKGGEAGLHVVVIGESQTRDHLGAYGYKRETTPWLTKMKSRQGFILFSNAYAAHTSTVASLTQSLTNASEFHDIPFNRSISLIDVLNGARYRTTWLSNQKQYGLYENPVTVLALSAHRKQWASPAGIATIDPDGVLLDPFRELLRDAEPKEVVFIHLTGSHLLYSDRYPPDRSLFFVHDSERQNDIDHYDNSVAYTDWILERIFCLAQETNRLRSFTYFSDHGEDPDGKRGHQPALFTYAMARIPLYIWVSDEFAKTRPEEVLQLSRHRNAVFSNDIFFDTYLGLLGVNATEYNKTQDLSSRHFRQQPEFLRVNRKHRISDDSKLGFFAPLPAHP